MRSKFAASVCSACSTSAPAIGRPWPGAKTRGAQRRQFFHRELRLVPIGRIVLRRPVQFGTLGSYRQKRSLIGRAKSVARQQHPVRFAKQRHMPYGMPWRVNPLPTWKIGNRTIALQSLQTLADVDGVTRKQWRHQGHYSSPDRRIGRRDDRWPVRKGVSSECA